MRDTSDHNFAQSKMYLATIQLNQTLMINAYDLYYNSNVRRCKKKKKQLHFALGKYVLGDLPTI